MAANGPRRDPSDKDPSDKDPSDKDAAAPDASVATTRDAAEVVEDAVVLEESAGPAGTDGSTSVAAPGEGAEAEKAASEDAPAGAAVDPDAAEPMETGAGSEDDVASTPEGAPESAETSAAAASAEEASLQDAARDPTAEADPDIASPSPSSDAPSGRRAAGDLVEDGEALAELARELSASSTETAAPAETAAEPFDIDQSDPWSEAPPDLELTADVDPEPDPAPEKSPRPTSETGAGASAALGAARPRAASAPSPEPAASAERRDGAPPGAKTADPPRGRAARVAHHRAETLAAGAGGLPELEPERIFAHRCGAERDADGRPKTRRSRGAPRALAQTALALLNAVEARDGGDPAPSSENGADSAASGPGPGRGPVLKVAPLRAEGRSYVVAAAFGQVAGAARAAPDADASPAVAAAALAFDAADYAAAAPRLLAVLPAALTEELARRPSGSETDAEGDALLAAVRLDPPASAPAAAPSDDDAARREADGTVERAARLLEASTTRDARGVLDLGAYGGVAGFWRAFARLIEAAPPAVRPLWSAGHGLTDLDPELLLAAGAADAVGAGAPRGAPSSAAATAARERLAAAAERLSTAAPPPWRDAREAAAELRARLADVMEAAEAGDDPLVAFLTEIDAPEAQAPLDATGRAAFLRRVVGAAQTGRLAERALPSFGRARAAGLIACAVGPEDRGAWEALRRAEPGRFHWSALLLTQPEWLPEDPIGGLDALSRLLAFDRGLRAALPAGAPTPMDGPAFQKRIRRLAARGAMLIADDPRALASEDGGRATWVALQADLFETCDAAAKADIAAVLDAVDFAGRLTPDGSALRRAAERVRRLSDLPPPAGPGLEAPRTGVTFAGLWLGAESRAEAAASGRVGSGPLFWREAFERWVGSAASEAAAADAAAELRARLDPKDPRQRRALEALAAAETRAAERAALGFGSAAAQAPRRLNRWLEAWRIGGAVAADPEFAGAAAAFSDPDALLGFDPEPALEQIEQLAQDLSSRADPAAMEATARFAIDALELWAGALAALEGIVRPADAASSGAAPDGSSDGRVAARGGGEGEPSASEAVEAGRAAEDDSEEAEDAAADGEATDEARRARVVDASVAAVSRLLWTIDQRLAALGEALGGAGLSPDDALGARLADLAADLCIGRRIAAAGAPQLWPAAARGAVAQLIGARLGPGPALYLCGVLVDGARAADARVTWADLRARFEGASSDPKRRGLAAEVLRAVEPEAAESAADLGARPIDAALAEGAARAWRGHFEAVAAARRAEPATPGRAKASEAPPRLDLAPRPSPDLDLIALEAQAALALHRPEEATRRLGSDLAWTFRQLAGLGLAARARPEHERAPELVRTAWERIAYSDANQPLNEPEMFFLFVATKLVQRAEATGDEDRVTRAYRESLRESGASVSAGGGAVETSMKGLMRVYAWLKTRTEPSDALEALDDAALVDRLDRALLLMALITQFAKGERAEPHALWEPLFATGAEAQRLQPPDKLIPRLERLWRSEDAEAVLRRRALAKILDRSLMVLLPKWQDMKRLIND